MNLSLPVTPSATLVANVTPAVVQQWSMSFAVGICLVALLLTAVFFVLFLVPDDHDIVIDIEWRKKE